MSHLILSSFVRVLGLLILKNIAFLLAFVLLAFVHADPGGLLGVLSVSDTAKKDTLKDTLAKPDTVHYESDSLEYGADDRDLYLMGHALLKYRSTVLKADTIWYNQETQLLEALGHPDVQDPSFQPFKGTRLKYNLKTRHGAVIQARSYKDGEYFRGAVIRRYPDKSIQIDDGDYCRCRGVDVPDYFFASEQMEIEPDKVATAAPVVLNVEEVPVLIAPFVLFPLGKGRRTGLLTPKLGGDQKQGFFVHDLGMYWGISDYMDLTTKGDIEEGSVGKFDKLNGAADFRYAKRYWLEGDIQGKRYLQQLGGLGSGWEARYTHDQQLLPEPGKFTLKGTGAFVSSATVRSDNASSVEQILDQTANADMTATYKWAGGSSMNVAVSQEDHLKSGIRTREYPGVSFQSIGQIFPEDDPDDSAWYHHFRYGYNLRMSQFADKMSDSIYQASKIAYDSNLAKGTPITRPRPLEIPYLGAAQTLELTTTHKFGFIDLNGTGSFRHDFTAYSYDTPLDPNFSTDYRPDQILTWNAGVKASTRFYGMWMPYWGRFAGLRHTVSPSVGYTFVPHVDPEQYFVANPRLSQVTYQNKSQLITFGLGQILDAKILSEGTDTVKANAKKGTPYSLINFSSTTSYDLQKDVHPWDVISSNFNTGLLQAIQLNGTMVHSFYNTLPGSTDTLSVGVPLLKSWSLSFQKGLRVSGSLSDGLRVNQDSVELQPWSLSMDYSYTISALRISQTVYQENRTQTAGFGADLKPSRDWSANWKSSYNFEVGSFVAHSLNFKRTLGCWDMTFGWTPVGPARGWTFMILIRDLTDVKFQAQSSTLRKSAKSSTPISTLPPTTTPITTP